jgi:hypothetical protein
VRQRPQSIAEIVGEEVSLASPNAKKKSSPRGSLSHFLEYRLLKYGRSSAASAQMR